MLQIAVLDDYQRVASTFRCWESLRGRAEVTYFHEPIPETSLVSTLMDFEVVVAMRERTTFSKETLMALHRLRLLITTGMVNEAIDIEAASARGIIVSGTGALEASPTTELTWALILSITRHVCEEDRNIREGRWQQTIGTELSGKTLGIVGLGRLGQQVATVAKAFGMAVIAWSPNLDRNRANAIGVRAVTKDELFGEADIVSLHLRLGESTMRIVGARELRLMKPSAFLVNTARGQLIDEPALVHALASDEIAGAALDVFESEPLSVQHPLRSMPNTVLTPHIGYVTRGNYNVFFGDVVSNIESFMCGRTLVELRRS